MLSMACWIYPSMLVCLNPILRFLMGRGTPFSWLEVGGAQLNSDFELPRSNVKAAIQQYGMMSRKGIPIYELVGFPL